MNLSRMIASAAFVAAAASPGSLSARAEEKQAEAKAPTAIEQHSVKTMEVPAPAMTIKDLKIGSPVFGTDGIKVGEINRIKAGADGQVTEIQVTTGGPAGLNAEVVAIKPEQIAANDAQSLKLKISGADAKNLPVLSNDSKG